MPSIYESFSIQNFSTKGPLTLNYHFLTDNPRKISLSAPFPDGANHVDFPLYYNRARKSRATLQNKVRLKVLPEQSTLFVNTSVTFKKCIIQSFSIIPS